MQDLSETQQYYSLFSDLNKAVEDGFMDLDADGSHYRFVHDKVREAAYDMISSDSKDQYHFDIGMALLHICDVRFDEKRNILSAILDQINHGVPSLLSGQSHRMSVAKLYYHAGAEAMKCYNYTSAYIHAKSAILLLPDDSWTIQHDLSLKLYFLLSKAAFSYNKLDEAKAREHSYSRRTWTICQCYLYTFLFTYVGGIEEGCETCRFIANQTGCI